MPTLLDHTGTPFKKGSLREPQTAQHAHLQRTFATHPAKGLTPQKMNSILLGAEQTDWVPQYDLFDDMEQRDTHLFAEMDKRKRAVMGLSWELRAPDGATPQETKLADQIREALNAIPRIENLFFALLDATGKGFAAVEQTWAYQEKLLLPNSMAQRPQQWFTTDHDTRSQLLLRSQSSRDGEALNSLNWIVHKHAARNGNAAVSALYRSLCLPYLYKSYATRDWAEFLEIHGLPIRLGKYPSGASDAEKATLLRAVTQMGHNAAGIMPVEMEFELTQAANTQSDPFLSMTRWAESSMSKAILGGTLTSQADGKTSTNALGEIHNEVRHDLRESDALALQSTLNQQLIEPIVFLNFGKRPRNRMPFIQFDVREKQDISRWADALPKLASVSLPIPESWALEQMNIPKAKDDEPILKPNFVAIAPAATTDAEKVAPIVRGGQPSTAPSKGEAQPGSRAAAAPASDRKPANNKPAATLRALFDTIAGEPGGAAALARANVDPGPSTDYSEQLARVAAPAMAETLKALRQIVEGAPDMVTLRQMLVDAFGDLPRDELAQVMGLAFAVADLAGRADVLTEKV